MNPELPRVDDVTRTIDQLWPLVMTYGVRIAGALALLVVGLFAAAWARGLVVRAMTAARMDETLTKFLGQISRWSVLVAVAIAALGIFGVETTSFAAVLGAAGLAIGLAFQGSLGNLAAGVMLLIFRPFKVRDVIRVAGETGAVAEIELMSTTLDTPDRRRIIVPNSSVFGSVIENLTHHERRRVDVAVGTDYAADLDETRRVLLAATGDVEHQADDSPPQVYLQQLGGSSVDWSVRVFVPQEHYWTGREQLTEAVKKHLDKAGIGIPFPQRDVHVYQMNDT